MMATARSRLRLYLVVVSLAVVAFGLALLPLRLVGLGLAALLLLALPLLDPVFGLYWAVLSVPIQDVARLPGGFTYTQAAVALAAFAWGLRVLAHPEQPIAKGSLFPLWALLLWALLLSASVTPYSIREGLKEALRWAEAFLIWLIAVNTVRRPWQLAGLLACLVLAPAAEAAIGLTQFVSGSGPPAFRIGPQSPFVRAYGTIGQPNSFAGYLNMAWPLALALAIGTTLNTQHSKPETQNLNPNTQNSTLKTLIAIAFWLPAGLLLSGLAASFSRGAWVGAALGALGMALALGRWGARLALAALAGGLVLLGFGAAGWLPVPLSARLASITQSIRIFDVSAATVTPENFAAVERMAQLQAGWRMVTAYPLTGVGPGNYARAYPDFAVPPWYASRGHAHNYYLHMAAEAGVAGALAYLALIAGVFHQALAALRRATSTFRRSAAVGCYGVVVVVAGHNLFENLHVLSMGVQLAAVWGLAAVLATTDEP